MLVTAAPGGFVIGLHGTGEEQTLIVRMKRLPSCLCREKRNLKLTMSHEQQFATVVSFDAHQNLLREQFKQFRHNHLKGCCHPRCFPIVLVSAQLFQSTRVPVDVCMWKFNSQRRLYQCPDNTHPSSGGSRKQQQQQQQFLCVPQHLVELLPVRNTMSEMAICPVKCPVVISKGHYTSRSSFMWTEGLTCIREPPSLCKKHAYCSNLQGAGQEGGAEVWWWESSFETWFALSFLICVGCFVLGEPVEVWSPDVLYLLRSERRNISHLPSDICCSP